ncbi:hypothetical protein [Bacteroides sp. 214]|uniref:hypothetical protein n=1 Tax=Bacteroides sp. 214 TaxID=2302935 RepID=UPI0013D8A42C|nr:hypothetical protein [Bacteroides sp. 214]
MEEQKKGVVNSEKQFVDSENIDEIGVFELFCARRRDVLYQKKRSVSKSRLVRFHSPTLKK